MGSTRPTQHRCLPLPLQDCQRVENLPHADALQTVGGRQDRLPGRPPGEIRGELHHQESAGEDARFAAQIRDGRPHIFGQRRGADPLFIRHAAEDGQPAVRCGQRRWGGISISISKRVPTEIGSWLPNEQSCLGFHSNPLPTLINQMST